MSKPGENLRQQLELKQKQLDLILTIDYIRDTLPEPSKMMEALARTLADHIHASLCLIGLVDRETKALALQAAHNPEKQFDLTNPEIMRELDRRTRQTSEVLLWNDSDVPESLQSQYSGDSLHVAVIPIFLKGERLGVLLFVRVDSHFGQEDVELIKIAESQIDSAVVQCYEYYTLQQRNKELETIYQVDHIRDQHLAFDDMLNAVLRELRHVIRAEAGFIMLYDKAEQFLKLRAATNDDLLVIAPHHKEIKRFVCQALRQNTMIWHNEPGAELHSIVCLPLILNEEIIGVLGVINCQDHQGFNSDDRRLLHAIASQMDTAIFEGLEQRRLREVLGRSVDPHIMERLLATPDVNVLKSERAVITVLYADIRGSTALAEQIDPELLVGFINDYLGRMTEVILSHEGTLDKFVGDEVMALFNAPFLQEDHALRAIHVAVKMQETHTAVMDTWEKRGVARCPIGIGIATGELIVGEIGCKKRTDYTVIGRAANLGARLCGVAKGGEIIISQATYDLVKDHVDVKPITGVQVKGVPDNLTIYLVEQIKHDIVEIKQ